MVASVEGRAEGLEYVRRRHEETVLYQVLEQHLEAWCDYLEVTDQEGPRFVERELRHSLVPDGEMLKAG